MALLGTSLQSAKFKREDYYLAAIETPDKASIPRIEVADPPRKLEQESFY